jgi:lipopolysaccharide/colanic/teichoic acid biosynthesis glycosyltransferase
VLSSVAILFAMPLFGVIALIIKLDSRGPVLFPQERVGFNRRRFRALKFRTMVEGAEGQQRRSSRSTRRTGRCSRSAGPAHHARRPLAAPPELRRAAAALQRAARRHEPRRPSPAAAARRQPDRRRAHKRRFSVRPHHVPRQVNGREPRFEEWIKQDMEYIDNWSLGLTSDHSEDHPAVLSGKVRY